MKNESLFNELKERGLIAQMTNEEKLRELLDGPPCTFYIGFDPTADSLHVGHFLQLIVMSHMQKKGHRPIVILGTGTTMVGDPTGKTDMRKMLSQEQIQKNAECFKKQMSRIVDFSDGKALMLKNGDWLMEVKYVDFLREIGVHFSVNKMLTYECFKTRLEKGLSFIEFNYMLMQSFDFLKLFETHGCRLQLGGDDQWANILGGIELVRRVKGEEVFGMTFNLLATKDGKKMGKTEKGALWLDPEKTSPYEFFQYWRNIGDDDVIRCMKMITFMPLEEIKQFEGFEGSALNAAKERLAFEITKLVHGADEATNALNAAKSLFGMGMGNEDMPTTQLSNDDFTENAINILDILLKGGLASSKGEGRRLIEQGGISVADVKVNNFTEIFSKKDFADGLIVRKGKKIFHKFVL